ncbi:MAG: hypothetical protein ABSC95_03605 [Acetobacteraceae bacterium]
MFGQVFFPSGCGLRLGGVASVACLLLLTTCTGDPGEQLQSGQVLAWGGSDGRWVGPVTPVDMNCGQQTTGLMSIGSSTFGFDPFQSAEVLQGNIGPSGNLRGEVVRSVPGNRSIGMSFLGRVQHSEGVESIVGTLTSGRCHWSVTLRRG